MNNVPSEPNVCRGCGGALGPGDRFCSRCGRRRGRGAGRADDRFYRPGWILLLSLTILGPLALGLVWRSPHLTRRGKAGMSAVIIVYSVACIALAVWLILFWWNWLQTSMAEAEMYY